MNCYTHVALYTRNSSLPGFLDYNTCSMFSFHIQSKCCIVYSTSEHNCGSNATIITCLHMFLFKILTEQILSGCLLPVLVLHAPELEHTLLPQLPVFLQDLFAHHVEGCRLAAGVGDYQSPGCYILYLQIDM